MKQMCGLRLISRLYLGVTVFVSPNNDNRFINTTPFFLSRFTVSDAKQVGTYCDKEKKTACCSHKTSVNFSIIIQTMRVFSVSNCKGSWYQYRAAMIHATVSFI